MQNFYDGSYNLTSEDKAVLLRALSRGMDSVNTLMPMMRDEAADAFVMDERELSKVLDAEWENYCNSYYDEEWYAAQDAELEDEPEGNYHNSYHCP